MKPSFDIINFNGGNAIAAKRFFVNEMIRAKEVRVIDSTGSQLGIMPTFEAISKAAEKGLDLILISQDANPPVCRIIDFGKLKYEQSKKEKLSKKGSRSGQVKEIKISPKISEHDFLVKANKAKEFLQKKLKVKITLMFRGREAQHPELGKKVLDKMSEALASCGKAESGYKPEGRSLILIFAPITK